MRHSLAFVVLMVGVAACSSGVPQADLDAAISRAEAAEATTADLRGQVADVTGERDELAANLTTAQSQITSLEEDRESLRAEIGDMQDRLGEMTGELREAEAELEDAQATIRDLMLAYDPQIQETKRDLAASALPVACEAGEQAARSGSPAPTGRDIEREIADLGPTAGFELKDLLDMDALTSRARECHEAERQRLILYGPHGSAFYTVGDEIGPGLWRSTGSGDGCYWERLKGLSGEFGDIIANYFGVAGVTVRIRASDVAFSSTRCGSWEYVGP